MRLTHLLLLLILAAATLLGPDPLGAAERATPEATVLAVGSASECEYCETRTNEELSGGGYLCDPSEEDCHQWQTDGGATENRFHYLGGPYGVWLDGPCKNCCGLCGGETLRWLGMGDVVTGLGEPEFKAFIAAISATCSSPITANVLATE